jgi:hypothetical protein
MASRYGTEEISLVAFSVFGVISADILALGSAGIDLGLQVALLNFLRMFSM